MRCFFSRFLMDLDFRFASNSSLFDAKRKSKDAKRGKQSTGDTTYIDIASRNLAVTNNVADRGDSGYKEYFVLRSDAYGWEGTMKDEGYTFDSGMVSHNYPDTDGDGDIWNDFRATMQGAYVTLDIDHSATGNVFVTATAVGTNGVELVMTYRQPVSAVRDIVAFLVCDGSYFEMKEAYLIPSKVAIVKDVAPVSIAVKGTPEFVEFGNEDFRGDATATVTYTENK